MNDHNLDDLIIDNIEPKNSKAKSFLTIVALFIVVLIVAIILTKIILKDPNADKLAFEENNSEFISPELTLQSVTEPKPTKKEPTLSNIMEAEPKAPAQAEKVQKEIIENTEKTVQTPQKPTVDTEIKKHIKEAAAAEVPEKKGTIVQKEAKKENLKKEIVKETVPLPEKNMEKASKHPAVKSVKHESNTKPAAGQIYYIQVGSFQKTPSTRFLGIIKNSGFNYKITSPTVNGTKKLLIGPYRDRASADTALAQVKDRINKSAFVIKK